MARGVSIGLAIALLALAGLFAARVYGNREQGLPSVPAPQEIAGRSCGESVAIARALTKQGALDRARLAYLWVVEHCGDATVLPGALLEAGSLLGYLLHHPGEAQTVYEQFLRRFPSDLGAVDATYHLAKLEIDAGDYASAVAHLTTLAERYPNSPHAASAQLLAAKAAELLAHERRSQRTLVGQLWQLVPNNVLSLLAVLAALGPSVIQTVSRLKTERSPEAARSRWLVPMVIIGLTVLNYVINNVDNARRNRTLMEKLDQLTASRVEPGGTP